MLANTRSPPSCPLPPLQSRNYGKFLSKEEIVSLVAPDSSEVDEVMRYLRKNGAFNVVSLGDAVTIFGMLSLSSFVSC